MSHRSPEGQEWVTDFTPGYLDSPESDSLPLGATPDAKNAFLFSINTAERRAVMGKRAGSRLLNPTAIAAATRIDGLFEFRRSGAANELLAVCNGGLSKFDGVDTFTAIGSGWTAGNTPRLLPFRNNAFVFDGAAQKRYDGTSLYDVGFAAPSSVSNMVAGVGTLTGTYEALYTWYNSALDRHSSPSSVTATLVLVGQGRTHTKPGGSVPTAATHWGIWVRRTDTSELNYFFVQNVAVATASQLETVTDVARQRGDLAPTPSENDPPPAAWKVLAEWKGYGIGILPSSDSYYTSKVGDLESWHPRNKFPVSRATGEDLTFAKAYGEEMLVGTGHATWRLEGDAPPFIPRSVHTKYGCVSPDAALEVDGKFYAWDRIKGPYVTDGVSFRRIGLHKIDDILATVNLDAVSDIRAVYSETHGLIGWSVPVSASTRRRTILWYHIDLDCWLPPHTGLEYGAFTEFTDANGHAGIYMGDYWGRVFELFSGAREGVPAESPTDNIRTGTVLSATSGTLTIDTAEGNLYTAGNGCAGLSVAVKSPGGTWYWRRIQSNTNGVITLDTTNDASWSTTPAAGWTWVVGGIEWWWWTPWIDFGIPHLTKKFDHLWVEAKSTSDQHEVTVKLRFNNDEGAITTDPFTFQTGQLGGIWGESLWGSALWAETVRELTKALLPYSALTAQIQLSNYLPDQEIKISRYGLTTDVKAGKKAPSIGGQS